MSKSEHIQAIDSYLHDGFIVIPADARGSISIDGTTVETLRKWSQIVKSALDSLNDADLLVMLPEGVLSAIHNYIVSIRRASGELINIGAQGDSAFIEITQHLEQLTALVSGYSNLADNFSYKSLEGKLTTTLDTAESIIKDNKKTFKAQLKRIAGLTDKSERVLGKASSGTLSKNFGILSNSKWNWLLLALSLVAAVISFILLVAEARSITSYLIPALEKGTLDYRVFFAKWSLTFPYLLLLSVSLLELRSRIKFRDTYIYRQNVAASLDGYTETLLSKVSDITNPTEQALARREVLGFMIDAMLELTKSPTVKGEKHNIGLELRDIGRANISSE